MIVNYMIITAKYGGVVSNYRYFWTGKKARVRDSERDREGGRKGGRKEER